MSLLFLPEFNLQAFNTFAVPASAHLYVKVSSDDELLEALQVARQQALPLLILGGGSNIVLCGDFPGLAIRICSHGKEVVAEDADFIWLRVAAGENWHALVEHTLEFHYWGLENLSLIPGTVGAAPIQNIGAYGVELKDVFAELTALEINSGSIVTFNADACAFGYRDSIFKQALKDKYVITSVTFKLRKQPHLVLDYPALRDALAHLPTEAIDPFTVSKAVCAIRRSKLPDPTVIPNAGSFFKNPVITRQQLHALRQNWPALVAYAVDDQHSKVAAGWLIDQLGWRGYQEGAVAVHDQQALVLTNGGRAGGDAILALASKIIASVYERYGIRLEREPQTYP